METPAESSAPTHSTASAFTFSALGWEINPNGPESSRTTSGGANYRVKPTHNVGVGGAHAFYGFPTEQEQRRTSIELRLIGLLRWSLWEPLRKAAFSPF